MTAAVSSAIWLSCSNGGGGGSPSANQNTGDSNANAPAANENANLNTNDNVNGVANANTSANENGPPEPAARWLIVHQDLPAALRSVQVTANGDVYAVGGDTFDGGGPYVIRYDASGWTQLRTGLDAGALWWVHEVGTDEIWMSGQDRLVLRYQPSTNAFTAVAPPPGSDTLFGIWGLSSHDVWAVGGTQTRGRVLRYDGASWSVVDEATISPSGLPPLFKVWGPRRDDVWIVGLGGVAIRFDGSAYALEQTETGRTLFTVHGQADGANLTAVGGVQPGEIWERIDGQWTQIAPEGAIQVNGVNFGPGGEGFAVGVFASTFQRLDGQWVLESNGLDAISDLDFHAVWVAPDGAAWAVGGELNRSPFDRGMVAYFGTGDPRGPIEEAE